MILCVRVCLCASVYTRYVCVECVLSQIQYTAAPQQQQHNGSRVSSSRLCSSTHDVCLGGWRTAGNRTTTMFSRAMQRSHSHRRTSCHVNEAYSSTRSGITSSYPIHVIGPPMFPFATPAEYQANLNLKGNLVPGRQYGIAWCPVS